MTRDINKFINICSIEQLYSDYLVFNDLNYDNVLQLRLGLVKLAENIFLNKKNTIQFNKIKFIKSGCYSTTFYNQIYFPESKIIESYSNYGVYPEDVFNTINKPKLKQIIFNSSVIGIRSAGSHFAPIVSIFQKDKLYLTLRPGIKRNSIRKGLLKTPFIISPNELSNIKIQIGKSKFIFIVDEGPGTTDTFRSSINYFKQFKKPIYILKTRIKNIPSISTNNQVTVKKREYLKIIKSDCVFFSNKTTLRKLPFKYLSKSLKEYESPKRLLIFDNKRIIAKYIGIDKLNRYDYLKKINYYYPKIRYFNKNIIYSDFLVDDNFLNTAELFNYFEHHFRYYKYTVEKYNWYCEKLIDEINHSFKIDWELKYLPKYTKSKIIKQIMIIKKMIGEIPLKFGIVDWNLEREEWIFNKNRVYKLDSFHYKDYSDLPKADKFIEFAGITIELKNYVLEVEILNHMDYGTLIQKKAIIKLNKIYYLFWKLNILSYILTNLVDFAYDRKFLEKRKLNYIAELNSLLIK